MKKTQKNKHTEHHMGLLKAKLAKLRADVERAGGGKGGGQSFEVKKAGAATIVLIGLPSVGKSTILNRLTNAKSKVAAYAFTTLTVVPGIMRLNGADIQILDLPGIISGASSGKGRGKRVLSVARNADLVLLVLDVFQPGQVQLLRDELQAMGIRLDQKRPDVVVTRGDKGETAITSTVKLTRLSQKTIKGIMEIYGVSNASIIIRDDITDDQLIDVMAGNRRYVPSLTVLNKVDLVNQEYLGAVKKNLGNYVPLSAEKDVNMEVLRDRIWATLDRSEEHTSELQSQSNLVCRLLL